MADINQLTVAHNYVHIDVRLVNANKYEPTSYKFKYLKHDL